MTLHLVNRSPYQSDALNACLRLAAPGAAVLLIEDAVVAAVAGSMAAQRLKSQGVDLRLYVLEADVRARGLSDKLMDGIACIDDAGFVALVVAHDKTVSWS
ncbi:MAG: sulfurtransferase complex subunit TusB [Gammaproteobacteria bacterium]|nr:sulfurtransferase complex subunit TusB [Gammaproteobacteria bacterium]